MDSFLIVGAFFALLAIVIIVKTAVIVPQQSAYIIENLGKYNRTLKAGFHILIPFLERIAYRHSLKETAFDIPRQICITKDNVQVEIDGVLYLQVLDPERASYGISNYEFAISQLAQTTLRSEIGKLELDRTFEERSATNLAIVEEIDKAAAPWGVKVLRYELKDINPPRDVLVAMEKQMRAEREKRATILDSEADRDAQINKARGHKESVVLDSQAEKERQINEAEGQAQAILAVASATAEGLNKVAQSLTTEGGSKAMELRIAEQYISEFGNIAREGNTLVLPANLADVGSMIALAKGMIEQKS
jgi:regulator of protease activity HflC (stomatin/prohibitin superfamily)